METQNIFKNLREKSNLTQEQLQKISINQIQSLSILSLSAESLRDLLQKESEENPFMEYTPSSTSYMTSDGASSFLNFIAAPEQHNIKQFILEQVNPEHFTNPNGRFSLISLRTRFSRVFNHYRRISTKNFLYLLGFSLNV